MRRGVLLKQRTRIERILFRTGEEMSLLLNAAWEKDFNVLTVDCASIPSTCMSIIDVTVKSVKYIILNN